MYKVTLDTNVILSGYFHRDEHCMEVLELVPDHLQWYISPFIAKECADVMRKKIFRKGLRRKGKTIDDVLQDIAARSILVYPTSKISVVVEDPSDDHILECAYDSGSDWLLSNDHHLYVLKQYLHIPILRPEEFLVLHEKGFLEKGIM